MYIFSCGTVLVLNLPTNKRNLVVSGILYDRTGHTYFTYIALNHLIKYLRSLVREIKDFFISLIRVTITFVYIPLLRLPFGD